MDNIIYNQDRAELEKEAAVQIRKGIFEAIQEKGFAIFGIPGGRSVSGIFQNLKELDVPWEKVHIFMVDDQLVPLHADGNYKLAYDTFLKELMEDGLLNKDFIHPFICGDDSDLSDIEKYGELLESLGGKFDVVLLSSGEDGHVGALYPNHHSIEDESEYFIKMTDGVKGNPRRMTSSRKLIQRSGLAVVVFFEEAKREALQKFIDAETKYEDCPVVMVKDIKHSVYTNILK